MVRGFYLTFADRLDPDANRRLHALTARLLDVPLEGITDLIPGYTSLYVEYDSSLLDETSVRLWVDECSEMLEPADTHPPDPVEIPVDYCGEDLPDIAARTGLSVDEVIEKHAAPLYHVYALGFSPGFPFLGEVDEAIRLPRRPTPRERVPAHTVAMANAQTGIYPTPSPGGWNLLGRTLTRLYDPHRDIPFGLEPGDAVRFVPSEGEPPDDIEPLDLLPKEPEHPLLRVLEPGLRDLVVDQGRFLAGRYGLCRSGPLDPHAAALANRLLGNPADVPVLELNLQGGRYEILEDGVLAFAGWGIRPVLNGEKVAPFTSFAVRAGDELGFQSIPQGSRGYLALAGGVESGLFMGSASPDPRAYIGRPLAVGDVLGVAEKRTPRVGFSFVPYRRFESPVTLYVRPGPQASPAALRALCAAPFTVKSADRMGVRLQGEKLEGGDVLSEAVPLGAVQVTSGGDPILLLNDRGTLGGYSKPAVLTAWGRARAAQLRTGEGVRFRLVTA